jgi:hypothetical protein
VLAVIVTVGVLGETGDGGGRVDRDGGVADTTTSAPAGSSDGLLRETDPTDAASATRGPSARTPIELRSPAIPNALVTTVDLVVRGSVRTAVGRVLVVLQSRGTAPIVVATTEPMNATRTSWNDASDTFVARLALPDPRPTGPALLQIVTYDQRGRAQDVLLRPILIGAVARLGEDGLGGGAD